MNKVLEFINDNYLFFLIFAIFLVFALIGYLTQIRSSSNVKIKSKKGNIIDENSDDIGEENTKMNVENL